MWRAPDLAQPCRVSISTRMGGQSDDPNPPTRQLANNAQPGVEQIHNHHWRLHGCQPPWVAQANVVNGSLYVSHSVSLLRLTQLTLPNLYKFLTSPVSTQTFPERVHPG